MPLFAQLISGWFSRLWSFLVGNLSLTLSSRLGLVLYLAALYSSLLISFNVFVTPLVSSVFNTAYGQLLGLLFPPISGTVVTGLIALWVGRVGYDYLHGLSLSLVK